MRKKNRRSHSLFRQGYGSIVSDGVRPWPFKNAMASFSRAPRKVDTGPRDGVVLLVPKMRSKERADVDVDVPSYPGLNAWNQPWAALTIAQASPTSTFGTSFCRLLCCALLLIVSLKRDEPIDYKGVRASEHRHIWEDAMVRELQGLMANRTFSPVTKPPDRKAVGAN